MPQPTRALEAFEQLNYCALSAGNGAGLRGEIAELQKLASSFTPPKPLVLTEWLARPAQPLAAAYPVIRDSTVAAYNWALVFVNCTTGWQKPVVSPRNGVTA